MRKLLISSLMAAAFAATLAAQPPGANPAAPGGRPRIVSPEALPDHRVTFRFDAPKASEAILSFGEGAPVDHKMTKGDDGVWSVTIGPVEPDIYTYVFSVDGVTMIDLNNPLTKTGGTITHSILEMWDGEPRFDQVQNVPHGSINIHTYTSTVGQVPRGLYVYLPAEYYSQPNKRYPVIYIWHGGGGGEGDWARHGRMGVILDNLIAQKKAVPMIVVAGNNNPGTPVPGYKTAARSAAGPGPGPGGAGSNYDTLKQEIVADIIPFVAKHYRTLENRESRAITGLSAGGGVGFTLGLSSLDLFANVGEFSTGMFGGVSGYADYDIETISPGFYKDTAATNKKLKVFYMSCGTEDPRFPFQKKAFEDIRAHGIDVTFTGYPGNHEWRVWRPSLAEFAQKLFK